MDADQLSRLTLGLYAQTVPLEVCKDAAKELSPPMRWSEWLEESGTLQRLAEWMCHPRLGHGTKDSLATWIIKLTGRPEWWKEDGRYVDACSAFGVPPVQIQVANVSNPIPREWHPASPALALATLREAMGIPYMQIRRDLEQLAASPAHSAYVARSFAEYLANPTPWTIQSIPMAVRSSHPAASRYRLRIGDSEWTEREV